MRKSSFLLSGLSFLVLVFWMAALSADANTAGLPQSLVKAHSVYIVNETGFADLEFATILEVEKWGRFELAESHDKADLILRLDNASHVRAVPEGQVPSAADFAAGDNAIPAGYTRVALLDPGSNQVLWSGLHKTDGGKVKSGHLLDELRDAFRDYDKGKR
jgi:hypothetical protein